MQGIKFNHLEGKREIKRRNSKYRIRRLSSRKVFSRGYSLTAYLLDLNFECGTGKEADLYFLVLVSGSSPMLPA
jgi:hypothetical protein